MNFYAFGRPLTQNTKLLLKQAELVTNERLHLNVVRRMYKLRFNKDIDKINSMNIRQLRGFEGSRMKEVYKSNADLYGIKWDKRSYNINDFSSGTVINQCLSIGNTILYSICLAVISALNLSPGLGFIHVGHMNSFIFDIADLYKADISIPIAFKVASENQNIFSHISKDKSDNIQCIMRKAMRDIIVSKKILKKIVEDIFFILDFSDECIDVDILNIWDYKEGLVKSGRNYS